MTPETARADDDDVGPRLPVRESQFQTLVLVIVAAVAVAAAGIAVWYKMSKPAGPSGEATTAFRHRDVNLRFEPPPQPWVSDSEMRARLDAPFFEVYRRDNPEAFMAFGARDFKDHEPRRSELDDVLKIALGKIIDRESLKLFENDFAKSWMGRDAVGFKFSGLVKGVGSVEGEALAVTYKGIGYWFLAWTGANEIYVEQKAAFDIGRSGCKLLDIREKWVPAVPPVVPYKNAEIGYSIFDAEHIWDEIEDDAEVKGQDAKADKYLVVYVDRKAQNKDIRARLIVAVLDGASDNPLKDAQAHVEQQANQLAESQGRYVFKEHTDPLEGDDTNPFEGKAPVKMLRATNETNPAYTWLYTVSAVRVGNKTVSLYAWCPWKDRARFDTKFVQIAKSLRADK